MSYRMIVWPRAGPTLTIVKLRAGQLRDRFGRTLLRFDRQIARIFSPFAWIVSSPGSRR